VLSYIEVFFILPDDFLPSHHPKKREKEKEKKKHPTLPDVDQPLSHV